MGCSEQRWRNFSNILLSHIYELVLDKKGMNITSYIEKPLSLKYPFSGLSTITKYNNEKLTSTKFSEKKTLFWKIFHFLRFHFLVELKKFFFPLQQNEIRIRKIFEILN